MKTSSLIILFCLAAGPAVAAATSAGVDDLNVSAPSPPVDLRPTAPVLVTAPPPIKAPPPAAPSANPLWAIPLKLLVNTRERPIFSQSRRPPPAVVVAAPVEVPPPPSPPRVIEKPRLSLMGTIVNGSDGYAIFMDQGTKTAVRVRLGSLYQGWALKVLRPGAASLEREGENVEITFPKPANDPGSVSARIMSASNARVLSTPPRLGLTGQMPTLNPPPPPPSLGISGSPFAPRQP